MKIQSPENLRKKNARLDKTMQFVITLGGYSIVASILAILLFLFFQSLPLAGSADLEEMFSYSSELPAQRVLIIGTDEYKELYYTLDENGLLQFRKLADNSLIRKDTLALEPGEKILSADRGDAKKAIFAAGTDRGRIVTGMIRIRPDFSGTARIMRPTYSEISNDFVETASDSIPAHIEKLAFRKNEDSNLFWAWTNHAGKLQIRTFDAEEDEYYSFNLTDTGEHVITALTFSNNAEHFIAATKSGEFFWYNTSDIEQAEIIDHYKASELPISATGFLLGDNGLVVGDTDGNVTLWFQVRGGGKNFKYRPIRQFEPHTAAITKIYSSPRNRTFATMDARGSVHLNYSTTGDTRFKFKQADHPLQVLGISPKSNGLITIDTQGNIGQYNYDDPHPEASLKGLMGKVWYEGYEKPEFVWQSTGGSDEFESKFSLVPLILGTLKGTFYAMLFSVPLALLAAIYVSQFAPVKLARTIKPTIEILAAFPSVVIGFLAGLYFSPLFDRHLMTVFTITLFIPLVFVLQVLGWSAIPDARRRKFPKGIELVITGLGALFAIWIASVISPGLEDAFFAGNFKDWMYHSMGIAYDSRNSLVVGFALGFAVTPIIFTVAEDALSNVPDSLTSASLAMGASRWQTVWNIILPAAAGGIFAAIMLGFGRAIGETMIVLMATGNTPILDFSPFNGFRAMSACIAVEIPEAPVGGTLYRILFLTAFLLFIFTFTINSAAAFISDRLRKKYARF